VVMPLGLVSPSKPTITSSRPPGADPGHVTSAAPSAPDPMEPTFMMLHLGALAPLEAGIAWLLFGGILGITGSTRRSRGPDGYSEASGPSAKPRVEAPPSEYPAAEHRHDPADLVAMSPRWQAILRGETPRALGPRVGRRLFRLVPSPWRCKFCNAPFRGPYAGVFRWIGYSPSRKNPHICARCMERAPEGGALVPVAVLFADIRGYTGLAERLSSTQATALLNDFYRAASDALLAHEAVLGQIAGDEVMALFVPGFAGPGYPTKSVEAARSLLRAVGYGTAEGSWLEVGVGICTGEEYVGNVGGGGFKDFTALGDVTNTAARLQAVAGGGEIVLCRETYLAVADAYPEAQPEVLQLKGKETATPAFRIRVEGQGKNGDAAASPA
jgi:adenylate cyclase